MFSKRSTDLEFLDLGPNYYQQDEYDDAMKKLSSIGKYLGGNRATFKAFERLNFFPESILDVGCGGGSFAKLLAVKYPLAKVVGIDTSPEAIRNAKEKQDPEKYPNLAFEYRNNPQLSEPDNSFDVVTTTLVCHHMTDQEIVDFLKRASKVARRTVIINDLHRHRLAYGLFSMVAPIFFNNRLVLHDGKLSIKRGFLRSEWVDYLTKAGLTPNQWNIKWNWAFRWVITINP